MERWAYVTHTKAGSPKISRSASRLAADFDFGRRLFPVWKVLSGIRFPERFFRTASRRFRWTACTGRNRTPAKNELCPDRGTFVRGPRTHEQGGIFLQLVGLRVLCCQLCLLWKTEVFPSALGFATGRSEPHGNPYSLDPSVRSGLGGWWANSFQRSSAMSCWLSG